ncbi:MAG: 4-hydroxy-3-methylbut-2-enyl diphosphate reductase [Crocinitomicaceae bacterium]|nr:4-hydroxy-3-methylbut-2-enyl diphosphate reductase [Crocinitomicaceae bacterium]|tara:strand:- start:7646 stop:8869 length:1224 start_codon:yes stop_codon:yes gene_type:complete
MKKFDIPSLYHSSFIGKIKELRKVSDPRKKNFKPTLLDFGPVQFLIARHFGFCYGVENAIEISYKTVEENRGKRVFLLSQMIHNPLVNANLQEKGIKFLMNTKGEQIIPWEELTSDDIVLIPAFGTTVQIENKLKEIGIQIELYDTTCPFVKKVWNMSKKLGDQDSTVIVHGKHIHEETRATFSHSRENAPTVVVKNLNEAKALAKYAIREGDAEQFYSEFEGKYSNGFNPELHFNKVGVVNQTTMLASDTHEIAEYFKKVMEQKFGSEDLKNHFVDTRDTLCYATNDNQDATYGLLEEDADLALVVGGYNSSNTSHLVELCERKFPTYYISSANEIKSGTEINHFNFHKKEMRKTNDWLGDKKPVKIVLTSGASCPDSAVDEVLDKVLGYFENVIEKETVLESFSG